MNHEWSGCRIPNPVEESWPVLADEETTLQGLEQGCILGTDPMGGDPEFEAELEGILEMDMTPSATETGGDPEFEAELEGMLEMDMTPSATATDAMNVDTVNEPSITVPYETRSQKCKRTKPSYWTKDEQRLFLFGVEIFGWGHWKELSEEIFRGTKKASQITSHAQKNNKRKIVEEKKRNSINDVELDEEDRVRLFTCISETAQARYLQNYQMEVMKRASPTAACIPNNLPEAVPAPQQPPYCLVDQEPRALPQNYPQAPCNNNEAALAYDAHAMSLARLNFPNTTTTFSSLEESSSATVTVQTPSDPTWKEYEQQASDQYQNINLQQQYGGIVTWDETDWTSEGMFNADELLQTIYNCPQLAPHTNSEDVMGPIPLASYKPIFQAYGNQITDGSNTYEHVYW